MRGDLVVSLLVVIILALISLEILTVRWFLMERISVEMVVGEAMRVAQMGGKK